MIYRSSSALVVDGADNVDAPILAIDNKVTTSALGNVTSETAGFEIENVADPATHIRWKAGVTTFNAFDIQWPGGDCNYVALADHNLAGREVRVDLYTSVGPDVFTTPIAYQTLPDNKPVMFMFPTASSLVLVKVLIGSGSELAEVGACYAGQAIAAERNIYVGHAPANLSTAKRSINGAGGGGDFGGKIIVGESHNTTIALTDLTPDWVYGDFADFLAAAHERPFFFAWRPESYPDGVAYGWLANSPRPVNSRANGMMEVSLEIEAIA